MKKIIFIMMSAAAMFAASCDKQDMDAIEGKTETTPEEATETILYADFEGDETSKTTAYIHDGKTTPIFEVGDQMKVYTSTGSAIGTVTSVAEDGLASISVSGITLTGDVYAIYPLAAALGNNSADMKFTIPETQHGTFAEANISASKLNGTRLTFKNVTSVFKVTAKPEVITSFVFEKAGIAGTYSINFNDYSVTPSSTANKITVNNIQGSGPYYIAVASGLSYSKDELVAHYYNASNVHPVGIKNSTKNIGPFVRSKIYNLGDAKLNYSLDGKFTVSAQGDLVVFAKSNIYWDGDSYEFEPSQTDIARGWDPNHVTHFYFTPKEEYAKADNSNWLLTPEGAPKEGDVFFTNQTATTPNPNITINGLTGIWRTLSIREWQYLIGTIDFVGAGNQARTLNGGTGLGHTCDFARVSGTYGMVIYDDAYWDEANIGKRVPRVDIQTEAGTTVTGVTRIPENSVFLPGFGIRDAGFGGDQFLSTGQAYYWTSESEGQNARCFDYNGEGTLYNTDTWGRNFGCCIRVATDVQ